MQNDNHVSVSALTVKDAAEQLKISERHVAKLIAQRALPSFKLGRRRLIRTAALQDFIERIETIAR